MSSTVRQLSWHDGVKVKIFSFPQYDQCRTKEGLGTLGCKVSVAQRKGGTPILPCSHLRPRNFCPLSVPTPAALTWISFSARSSCRGSPLPAAQLCPENIEHGEGPPHLPQFYPQQPGAQVRGAIFPEPSHSDHSAQSHRVGEGEEALTPPPQQPPAQLLLPAHLLPAAVPRLLVRTPPAQLVGTHAWQQGHDPAPAPSTTGSQVSHPKTRGQSPQGVCNAPCSPPHCPWLSTQRRAGMGIVFLCIIDGDRVQPYAHSRAWDEAPRMLSGDEKQPQPTGSCLLETDCTQSTQTELGSSVQCQYRRRGYRRGVPDSALGTKVGAGTHASICHHSL